MQVRRVIGTPRWQYQAGRRFFLWLLRWTFIVIGAGAAASVLFTHLYRVNETIYDPSLFAIGVGGLFSHGVWRDADGAVTQRPASSGSAPGQGTL